MDIQKIAAFTFGNVGGKPRHLQPCSATYRTAFSTCRLL